MRSEQVGQQYTGDMSSHMELMTDTRWQLAHTRGMYPEHPHAGAQAHYPQVLGGDIIRGWALLVGRGRTIPVSQPHAWRG